MNRSHIRIAIALLAALPVAHAGVVIETAQRDRAGKEVILQITQIDGGQSRMESGSADSKATMIFKNDTLYILDAAKKTYTTMDKATIEQMGAMMSDAMTQMRQQMANLPPEQRAAMENMMKQRGINLPSQQAAHSFDAQPTGGTEKAADRTCKVWNITRDGQPWQQVCVVALDNLPGKNEFQSLARSMQPLLDKLKDSLKDFMGSQFANSPLQQESGLYEKMKGVPFITRQYENGVLGNTTLVIKTWSERSIPASQFEIPAGYTQQSMPASRPPTRR